MPDARIRFACPSCGKRFAVPPEHAGRRSECPSCGARISVPRPPEKPIGFPCRLCGTRMYAPVSKVGKKAKCPDCDALTEIPAPPPPPMPQTPAAMHGEQYEVYEGEQPHGVDLARAAQPTVAFVCGVCQTHLQAEVTRIGEFVPCPDCGAETRVPSPPKKPESKLDLDPDFYAVDDSEPAAAPHAALYEEYSESRPLGFRDSASQEGQRRKSRVERAADPSTAPRWGLGFFFGFTECILTPGMIGASLGLTALSSLLLACLQLVSLGGVILLGFSVVALSVMGMIWLGLLATVSWNVVSDVSGGARRVTEWPTIDPSEWIGPALRLLVALVLSVAPGVAVARGLPGLTPPIEIPTWALSLWLVLPVILLSQLDTESWYGVLSSRVLTSMAHAPITWVVFYTLTGGLLAGSSRLETMIIDSANVWLLHAACALDVGVTLLYAWCLGRLAWTAGSATPAPAADD